MNTATINKAQPSAVFRWMILLFISLAMFGNYYVYDSVSPLADVLMKKLSFTDGDIGLLQAIYSFPNILMVLIGGIIIDRIGTRLSSFIFAALCLIGALITALNSELWTMAAGRLIFGLGAESLIVAVTTTIGKWFKGKQLSFAFGLNLTIARLGSFAALNSPSWGAGFYDDWQMPLLVSAGAAAIALLAVVVYWGMDAHAEKAYNIVSKPQTDKVNFKEIFSFSTSYWYIVLLCVTFYSAIFPFQTFVINFFQEVHNLSRETGGFLSSLLILASMILTPLFGLLSDYIGKRSTLMMIGSLMLIPVYLSIYYISPGILLVPMIVMGISFSLIPAVMWPSVAIIVPESKLGTAYGLMTMIQNIGLFGFNLIVGLANDLSNASPENPSGYLPGLYIFSTLGFFGFFFAYMLRRSERGPNGHGLENGYSEKQVPS